MENLLNNFLEKCKKVHGDKFDYSLVEYKNKNTKVRIMCEQHGIFEQTPGNHINQKQGCPQCSGVKKSNTEEFILKSKSIHGDKYDYSQVTYKNNKTKVKIICRYHGTFEQKPNNHLQGQDCQKCVNNNIKSCKEEFIKKSIDKFGNLYDYSLVDYKSGKTKIKLICPKHGIFEQTPQNHLKQKIPCKKCDSEKRIIDISEIKERLREIHNDYYDYSKLEYTGRKNKSIIVCPIHGEFKQQIHAHILGSGCKKCSQSNGEKLISHILKENNLNFKTEHKFVDCKYKTNLKFDFYIPSKNLCIEFNGLQHYKIVPFFGGEEYFNEIIKRDKIKEEYCKSKNIKLLVIKYGTDKETIKNTISSYLE
jgi:hypothetical protein